MANLMPPIQSIFGSPAAQVAQAISDNGTIVYGQRSNVATRYDFSNYPSISPGPTNVTLLPLTLEGVTPTAPTYVTPPQSM